MKLNDVLYKTPELTEDKLIELILKFNNLSKSLEDRIIYLTKENSLEKAILKEWDKIQAKKSFLTRGERDKVNSLVSFSLVQMMNGNIN